MTEEIMENVTEETAEAIAEETIETTEDAVQNAVKDALDNSKVMVEFNNNTTKEVILITLAVATTELVGGYVIKKHVAPKVKKGFNFVKDKVTGIFGNKNGNDDEGDVIDAEFKDVDDDQEK